MDETNFVHRLGSKPEPLQSVASRWPEGGKTCPRSSGPHLCCAMVIRISHWESVSIRLPCCLCDKCATCRRWKTLPTFSLYSSQPTLRHFHFPLTASSSVFLSGVKLKETMLRSSACHASVRSLFQSLSVHARFHKRTFHLWGVWCCPCLSVWFLNGKRAAASDRVTVVEAHLHPAPTPSPFICLRFPPLLQLFAPTLVLRKGLISTHNEVPHRLIAPLAVCS